MAKKAKKKKRKSRPHRSPLRITGPGDELHYHINSGRVVIRPPDLIKYFRDFRAAIEKTLSLTSFIAVISLWLLLLTSDLRPIFSVSPVLIKGIFIGIIILITCSVFIRCITRIFRLIIKIFKESLKKYVRWFNVEEWLDKTESDPDKKVSEIISKCKE